jgi:hypothetical protein
MAIRIDCWKIVTLTAVGLWLGGPASAQTIKTGRTAFENLAASYAPERAPGAMVDAGFARAQASADAAWRQVTAPGITVPENPIEPFDQFIVDALTTIVEQLLNTINFLGNRLLARAGLMPLLPPETFFPDADSSTNGDGSGDSSDGSGDSTDGGDRSRDRT